ncbi:putative actin related protein 2/3 complex, subunit 5 [Monocercomonoides exilis]|uniref:putative actin related protein 2/3 complex, subunit 5 n=1 Tax=Monocercomonoides exilis TaxID=2049356 RepID=UPI003559E987|nr:putative actin related protein 2/3 complex, subunit 5 [Monocercomonoides exilis]
MEAFIQRASSAQPREALNILLEAALTLNIAEHEDSWCPVALDALMKCKDTALEMNNIINPLQLVQMDALMRVIYFGLEKAENCQFLLKWHAAVYEKAGVGSIVRYLCDRPLSKTIAGDNDELSPSPSPSPSL